MIELIEKLQSLEPKHTASLQWFHSRSGDTLSWPGQLPDGTLLASKAKGIYKPAWSKYALSVRQSLGGPYADKEPVQRADGTWSYWYFQENPDPQQRDAEYTNRGLMECLKDQVPVGVFRQIKPKPKPQYSILGLALVNDWEDGFFVLEGFSPSGQANGPRVTTLIESMVKDAERSAESESVFDPSNLIDARERTVASIVRRRGQPAFRKSLIDAYGGKCAITGCDLVQALEAAHIVPYKGADTNQVTNGLLLRADLHTLFDLGLLAIDSASMTLVIRPDLVGSSYRELAGSKINLPSSPHNNPSKAALDYHKFWAGI